MKFTNAWHDEQNVYVVEARGPTSRRFHTFPAEWSGFVSCASSVAGRISRAREVVSVVREGDYYRCVCPTEQARNSLFGRLRDELGSNVLREFDVSPDRRFVTDNVEMELYEDVRCLLVDVECQEPGKGIDSQRVGDSRILYASARDLVTGEEVYGRALARWNDGDERELVLGFWQSAKSYDVLVAWNGEGYDRLVFSNRTARLEIRATDVIANPRFRGDLFSRWTWLDQEWVDKKSRAATDDGDTKSASGLAEVVYYRAGETKVELPTRGQRYAYYKAWRSHRDWLEAYGSHDTHLQYVNEQVTGYVEAALAAMRLCHCAPTSANLGPIRQADGLVLRESLPFGYRWPTVSGAKKETKWRGAYVHEPELVGVVDGVQVLDFAGMYPRNAASGHMSPENHEDPESPNACRLPGREGAFRRDRRGIFPSIIDKLLAARSVYQKQASGAVPGSREYSRAKALSDAAKIVANSIAFGVTGTTASRFCDKQTFEGITTTGAWLIRRVADEAREWGAHVFAGDSDSIFTRGFDDEQAAAFCSHLNSQFPKWLEPYGWVPEHNIMELECDEGYARMVVDAVRRGDVWEAKKKRYIARYDKIKGRTPKPGTKHKVKGWAFRRGDSLRLQRRVEAEFFDLFLGSPSDPLPARESLTPELFSRWITQWRNRVVSGDFSLDDVVRRQGLSRTFAQYEAGRAFTKSACSCGYKFATGTRADGPKTCPKCHVTRDRTSLLNHVRVANERAARGDTPVVGDKIPWVYVLSDDGRDRVVADAERVADERWLDRASVWDRVYSAIRQQLVAAFPEHDWPRVEESKIRKRQHRELLPDAVGLLAVAQSSAEREVEVHVQECHADALCELVARWQGSDRLVIVFDVVDEGGRARRVRATTTATWDARLARCNDSRLRQTGAASYAFG